MPSFLPLDVTSDFLTSVRYIDYFWMILYLLFICFAWALVTHVYVCGQDTEHVVFEPYLFFPLYKTIKIRKRNSATTFPEPITT